VSEINFYTMKSKKPDAEKPKPSADGNGLGPFWWNLKGVAIASGIAAAVKSVEQAQIYRQQADLRHLRLYGNTDIAGMDLRTYWRTESLSLENQAPLNLVESVIDTVQAKIAKSRPRASFQTFGGNFGQAQKAKKLGRFCQGAFYEADVYAHSQMAFLLSCIFGTGALLPYEDKLGRIRVENVPAPEFRVDDAEAIHGDPRQLHRVKFLSREVVKGLFPDDARLISKAARVDTGGQDSLGDMIRVVESWHLPSVAVDPDDEDAVTDGMHVFTLENGTLGEPEPYLKDYFPFAFLRWKKKPFGFWGKGLSEQLSKLQLEINRLMAEIQETLRLVSKGRIFVDEGSKIVESHMRGGMKAIGDIIKYRGNPPTIAGINAVPPEQFAQLDRLWQRGFEQAGVSQMAATAKKPAGLDSGAALREYDDIGNERFSIVGQDWERFHMELSRRFIDLAREISKREGKDGKKTDYAVKNPGKRFLEKIPWSEVDLDDDAYVMQVFPVSSLPTTPAARTQTVQEWINAGFVDRTEGRRLLEFPDLEASTNLAVAALDDVDATIDSILDTGKYYPPEEYQALDLLVSRAQSAYLRARHEDVPEDRLDMLRLLITDAADLIVRKQQQAMAEAQAAQAQAAPAPAGPGAPMAPAPGAPVPPAGPNPVLQ
jgi:hypothetical protein